MMIHCSSVVKEGCVYLLPFVPSHWKPVVLGKPSLCKTFESTHFEAFVSDVQVVLKASEDYNQDTVHRQGESHWGAGQRASRGSIGDQKKRGI